MSDLSTTHPSTDALTGLLDLSAYTRALSGALESDDVFIALLTDVADTQDIRDHAASMRASYASHTPFARHDPLAKAPPDAEPYRFVQNVRMGAVWLRTPSMWSPVRVWTEREAALSESQRSPADHVPVFVR